MQSHEELLFPSSSDLIGMHDMDMTITLMFRHFLMGTPLYHVTVLVTAMLLS